MAIKKHECDPFQGNLPRLLRRYRKRITDYFADTDGMWVYFVPGWKRSGDDIHFVHVDMDAEGYFDLVREVADAEPCHCSECLEYIRDHKGMKGAAA